MPAHWCGGDERRFGFLHFAGDVVRRMIFGDSVNTKKLIYNLNEQLNAVK
jgi:hypothetical protein